MDLNIEFSNLDRSPIRIDFLRKLGQLTIKNCGLEQIDKRKLLVSVVSVGRDEIKKLNRTYRKVDETTDILSFAEYASRSKIDRAGDKEVYLGEIFLCYNEIEDYSIKKKIDPKEELARVFAHGILHLLAFRHGKKMFAIQDKAARDFINETKR